VPYRTALQSAPTTKRPTFYSKETESGENPNFLHPQIVPPLRSLLFVRVFACLALLSDPDHTFWAKLGSLSATLILLTARNCVFSGSRLIHPDARRLLLVFFCLPRTFCALTSCDTPVWSFLEMDITLFPSFHRRPHSPCHLTGRVGRPTPLQGGSPLIPPHTRPR